MSIRSTERGILAALQPLSGTRATGTATATATGADVIIPLDPPSQKVPGRVRAAHLVPIFTSDAGVVQAAPQRPVKTMIGPGLATITAAGVSVPVASVIGGAAMNLPAGALLRWDPPIAGLEPFAVVDAPGLTGGTDPTSRPQARSLTVIEGLGSARAAADLTRGKVALCPALVLSWEGSTSDEVLGRGETRRTNRFRIYVVTSRLEGQDERADEGKELLDAVAEILGESGSVDDEVFSAPPVRLGSAGRGQVSETSFIYWIDISTRDAVQRLESRTFAPWLTSQELISTPEGGPDALVIVDQTQNMP